jgi:hypothetical protein
MLKSVSFSVHVITRPVFKFYTILAACLQCYCVEIQQMLTFHMNLTARKPSIGLVIPYVSLNITEEIIIPKHNIFTGLELRTFFGFVNLLLYSYRRNNVVLGYVLLWCLVSELQKPPSPGLELFRRFDLSEISSSDVLTPSRSFASLSSFICHNNNLKYTYLFLLCGLLSG